MRFIDKIIEKIQPKKSSTFYSTETALGFEQKEWLSKSGEQLIDFESCRTAREVDVLAQTGLTLVDFKQTIQQHQERLTQSKLLELFPKMDSGCIKRNHGYWITHFKLLKTDGTKYRSELLYQAGIGLDAEIAWLNANSAEEAAVISEKYRTEASDIFSEREHVAPKRMPLDEARRMLKIFNETNNQVMLHDLLQKGWSTNDVLTEMKEGKLILSAEIGSTPRILMGPRLLRAVESYPEYYRLFLTSRDDGSLVEHREPDTAIAFEIMTQTGLAPAQFYKVIQQYDGKLDEPTLESMFPKMHRTCIRNSNRYWLKMGILETIAETKYGLIKYRLGEKALLNLQYIQASSEEKALLRTKYPINKPDLLSQPDAELPRLSIQYAKPWIELFQKHHNQMRISDLCKAGYDTNAIYKAVKEGILATISGVDATHDFCLGQRCLDVIKKKPEYLARYMLATKNYHIETLPRFECDPDRIHDEDVLSPVVSLSETDVSSYPFQGTSDTLIYVITSQGKLIIHSTELYDHANLGQGKPVLAAGEIQLEKKQGINHIVSINDRSGSYMLASSKMESHWLQTKHLQTFVEHIFVKHGFTAAVGQFKYWSAPSHLDLYLDDDTESEIIRPQVFLNNDALYEKRPLFRSLDPDDIVLNADDIEFQTLESIRQSKGHESYLFVIGKDKKLYVAKRELVTPVLRNGVEDSWLRHPELVNSQSVYGAGTLYTYDGFIKEINNKTGHYACQNLSDVPDLSELYENIFKQFGFQEAIDKFKYLTLHEQSKLPSFYFSTPNKINEKSKKTLACDEGIPKDAKVSASLNTQDVISDLSSTLSNVAMSKIKKKHSGVTFMITPGVSALSSAMFTRIKIDNVFYFHIKDLSNIDVNIAYLQQSIMNVQHEVEKLKGIDHVVIEFDSDNVKLNQMIQSNAVCVGVLPSFAFEHKTKLTEINPELMIEKPVLPRIVMDLNNPLSYVINPTLEADSNPNPIRTYEPCVVPLKKEVAEMALHSSGTQTNNAPEIIRHFLSKEAVYHDPVTNKKTPNQKTIAHTISSHVDMELHSEQLQQPIITTPINGASNTVDPQSRPTEPTKMRISALTGKGTKVKIPAQPGFIETDLSPKPTAANNNRSGNGDKISHPEARTTHDAILKKTQIVQPNGTTHQKTHPQKASPLNMEELKKAWMDRADTLQEKFYNTRSKIKRIEINQSFRALQDEFFPHEQTRYEFHDDISRLDAAAIFKNMVKMAAHGVVIGTASHYTAQGTEYLAKKLGAADQNAELAGAAGGVAGGTTVARFALGITGVGLCYVVGLETINRAAHYIDRHEAETAAGRLGQSLVQVASDGLQLVFTLITAPVITFLNGNPEPLKITGDAILDEKIHFLLPLAWLKQLGSEFAKELTQTVSVMAPHLIKMGTSYLDLADKCVLNPQGLPSQSPELPAKPAVFKSTKNRLNHRFVAPHIVSKDEITKETGDFLYVISEKERLTIAKRMSLSMNDAGHYLPASHIDISKGKPVISAGMIKVQGGKIIEIDNQNADYEIIDITSNNLKKLTEQAFQTHGFESVQNKFVYKKSVKPSHAIKHGQSASVSCDDEQEMLAKKETLLSSQSLFYSRPINSTGSSSSKSSGVLKELSLPSKASSSLAPVDFAARAANFNHVMAKGVHRKQASQQSVQSTFFNQSSTSGIREMSSGMPTFSVSRPGIIDRYPSNDSFFSNDTVSQNRSAQSISKALHHQEHVVGIRLDQQRILTWDADGKPVIRNN